MSSSNELTRLTSLFFFGNIVVVVFIKVFRGFYLRSSIFSLSCYYCGYYECRKHYVDFTLLNFDWI